MENILYIWANEKKTFLWSILEISRGFGSLKVLKLKTFKCFYQKNIKNFYS